MAMYDSEVMKVRRKALRWPRDNGFMRGNNTSSWSIVKSTPGVNIINPFSGISLCPANTRIWFAFDACLDWLANRVAICIGSIMESRLGGGEREEWGWDEWEEDEKAGAHEVDLTVDIAYIRSEMGYAKKQKTFTHSEDWDDQPGPNEDEDFDGNRMLMMEFSEELTAHLNFEEELDSLLSTVPVKNSKIEVEIRGKEESNEDATEDDMMLVAVVDGEEQESGEVGSRVTISVRKVFIWDFGVQRILEFLGLWGLVAESEAL
ncbi:hypothetical protein M408DRAFT_311353 [Serendipita vermifera MAFF 305830]|uniref:Uncharacterized protein n=1 Tax=Serendipita vermifera MAFF 305830 TaxID=933852 RepID=A0A0C3AII6_SERVB|nr:hypothetical protein M408DRAFT_311353 [Serendipita vermifera MAFF 305830]